MSEHVEIVKKSSSALDKIRFVPETLVWGTWQSVDPRKNWDGESHSVQHGVNDARSEISMMLSGTMEALGTGNYLTAIGRPFALVFDLLHSTNLVRNPGDGRDRMTGKLLEFNIPKYVVLPEGDGPVDAQDLRMVSLLGAGKRPSAVFGRVAHNTWLFTNRAFNLKMFPNAAGRTVELTTGLGLLILGSILATQNGGNTTTFDFIRGLMEAGIGAGTAVAATIDIMASQNATDEEEEAEELGEFIQVKRSESVVSTPSLLTAVPRAMMRMLADMYNDATLSANINEILEAEGDEGVREYLNRPEVVEVLERQRKNMIPDAVRGVIGNAVGEVKELKDSFSGIAERRANGEGKIRSIINDLKDAPPRYGGAVQLATGQLALPLAIFTGVGGVVQHSGSIPAMLGFAASGACMLLSYYFKNRSSIAKTKMTLRGTELNAA